jgi:hypothetical protein
MKIFFVGTGLFILAYSIVYVEAGSHGRRWGMDKKEVVKKGISFGTALAIAISWSVNKSILWAIIHGCLSWFYVIYYAIVRPR